MQLNLNFSKKSLIRKGALLFSMLLQHHVHAQTIVPPSILQTFVPGITLYNCFEPVVNCDMLYTGYSDARPVLKAIAWDNGTKPPAPPLTLPCADVAPASAQAFVYIEDWNGNAISFALQPGSKQPDIVLADDINNPGQITMQEWYM